MHCRSLYSGLVVHRVAYCVKRSSCHSCCKLPKIERLRTDSVRIASGKTPHTRILTPEEHLPRIREFMLSDKPFRENTANALMPEVPAPVKNHSMEEALQELSRELSFFFDVFQKNGMQISRNPFFGDLSFEDNVHLLYKHAQHHLRQFGQVI